MKKYFLVEWHVICAHPLAYSHLLILYNVIKNNFSFLDVKCALVVECILPGKYTVKGDIVLVDGIVELMKQFPCCECIFGA